MILALQLPDLAGVSVDVGPFEPLPEPLAGDDDAVLEAGWCGRRLGVVPAGVADAFTAGGWPARVIDFDGGVAVVVRCFDLAAVLVARGPGVAAQPRRIVDALLAARPIWDRPACPYHLFEGFPAERTSHV